MSSPPTAISNSARRPGRQYLFHEKVNHEVHQDHEAIDRRTEEAARQIVDAGLKVHKSLGPGLLESAYEHCLAHELVLRGVLVRKQVAFPILYEGEKLDAGFRIDQIVDE